MGGSAYKNPRKIFSQTGNVDTSSIDSRITNLEDNEYKITYFTEISNSTGTITIPTGATILLDQFQGGVDAYVSTIQNGQPTGVFPQTGGGVTVDVSSFDALGNYTLSGTPSSYPVALIYILKIKAKDYSNLTIDNILDLEEVLVDSTFGQFINTLTSKTTPVDSDYSIEMDSADSNKAKKVSWANRKATLKSYFDTLYATIADVKNFNYGSVTPYTSTSTAIDEVAFVIPISAGKLVTGDYFEWWNLFETNSTANSKTFRLWISTANETIGNAVSGSATQIGIFSVTTSSQSAIMTRRFAVLSDTTILSKSSSAANFRDDLTSETGVPINVTIPTLANQTYFVVTVNRANSGDTLIAKITELQLRKK